jgi:aspartyl-tRNA(Asn)/glutamyl-tRNA(Gln) amidotransferase subunit B
MCMVDKHWLITFLLVDHERRRHLQHYLSHPDTPLRQETRGFDEAKGETFTLRTKEEAEDYRYMPDGNLPPIVIKPVSIGAMCICGFKNSQRIRFLQEYLDRVTDSLPELPDDVRRRLPEQYGISLADTEVLLSMDDLANTGVTFFEEVVQGINSNERGMSVQAGKQTVNWIVNELLGQSARREETWTTSRVPANVLGDLLRLINSGELTGKFSQSTHFKSFN